MKLCHSGTQHFLCKVVRMCRRLTELHVRVGSTGDRLDEVSTAISAERSGLQTWCTAWNASRNAPCPRRGRGNSERHRRSGLQKTSSTGGALSTGRLDPMIPRDCMTSIMIWTSSAQLRGSWKTKMADIGVIEKSTSYDPAQHVYAQKKN